MRTRQFAVLEMMSPDPGNGPGLDQRMAGVLVHARAMEFQSLELEVSASVSQAKQAFELDSDDVCVVPQGLLFGHNPLAFYALLGLIADMRKVG